MLTSNLLEHLPNTTTAGRPAGRPQPVCSFSSEARTNLRGILQSISLLTAICSLFFDSGSERVLDAAAGTPAGAAARAAAGAAATASAAASEAITANAVNKNKTFVDFHGTPQSSTPMPPTFRKTRFRQS